MDNQKAIPYRRSSQLNELNQYRIKHSGERSCVIWQSNDNEKFVYSSRYFNINKQYRTFMFVMTENPQFDLSKPIYVRFEDGLMFKSYPVNYMQECLTLRMPEEFMAYEYREYPRIKFKPSDIEYANIVLETDIISESTQELSFQIIDYSSLGIALNLSDIHLKKFQVSKKVLLKKLFMVSLANEIEMTMVYSKKIRFKKDGEVYTTNRCGFTLERPIEDYLLKMNS